MCENEVIPYIDGVLRDLFLSKKSYFMYDTTLGGITTRSGENEERSNDNEEQKRRGYVAHER